MIGSAEFPASAPPRPVVAEHEVVRLIGRGAAGEVWLARNALGTYRAVKVIRRNAFPWRKPFEDEYQGLLRFEPLSRQHDALVDVLQVGGSPEADSFYYVMELADDVRTAQNIHPEDYQPRTLAHDLAECRRRPIGECIRLGAPIASALGFLHRRGLIHRDVKPDNIIFVNGFPKLADAGLITEMSASRSRVGTDGFIAPEGPGTARADMYGLGKVLYEMSTGKNRNDYPELPADLGNTAEARDVFEFNKIVVKACRANPRSRFRDTEEMMAALLSFQFSRYHPLRRKITKTSYWVISVGGTLVAIGVITFLVWRIITISLHAHAQIP